jgi:hypothetical protein
MELERGGAAGEDGGGLSGWRYSDTSLYIGTSGPFDYKGTAMKWGKNAKEGHNQSDIEITYRFDIYGKRLQVFNFRLAPQFDAGEEPAEKGRRRGVYNFIFRNLIFALFKKTFTIYTWIQITCNVESR